MSTTVLQRCTASASADQAPDEVDGCGGIPRVPVGADVVGEILVYWGPADDDLYVLPGPGLGQSADDPGHLGHGGGEQGGQCQDLRPFVGNLFDKGIDSYINS